MRATETILFEHEIETLDTIKKRLGLPSRSDAVRVLIAKLDVSSITPADAANLTYSGAVMPAMTTPPEKP